MTTKTRGGLFGPVTGPDGSNLDPTRFEYKGSGKKEKRLVDVKELPDEYQEAIEADDFVIYGKASVEQVDEDGQIVDVNALEGGLDQFFRSSNISRRHKDVRVGEPLPEWKLDEDRTIDLGDEKLELKAGDTLSTGVNPDIVEQRRTGELDDDEFWIVANIWNDTEIAKDTRLRTLSGDLNGFSVTVYAKETESTRDGEKVTDLDWHATTIGSDEKIKNKASRYGLAEFKALFTDDGGVGNPSRGLASIGGKLMFRNLLKKSADETGFNGELLAAASDAVEKAQTEDGVDVKEAAEAVSEDADFKSDDVLNAINVLQADSKAGSDDLEELLEAVESGDMTADEAIEHVTQSDSSEQDEEMEEKEDEESDDEPPEDDDDEEEDVTDKEDNGDDDEEEDEKSFEEKLEEHGVVTEDKLDEKLDEHGDNIAEKMADSIGDQIPDADEIAEKMDVGSTQDPDSGNGAEERDYMAEMKGAFSGNDGGDE